MKSWRGSKPCGSGLCPLTGAFLPFPQGALYWMRQRTPGPSSDSHKDTTQVTISQGIPVTEVLLFPTVEVKRYWHGEWFSSATHTPPPGGQPFLVMSHVHLLGQSLRFDEDVEIGLLQLLSYHGEDSGCGTELSQVVYDELEEQLKEKANTFSFRAETLFSVITESGT